MPKRHWWLLATTAIFAAGSANAQSPDLDKVDRMQRQMEQLQEQMKQVKSELVEAKKKAAEVKAEASAFEGAYAAATGGSAAKAPVAPPSAIVTMSGANRPSICTPDQLNCIP
jgi:phosphate-selective porin OprO/OprP